MTEEIQNNKLKILGKLAASLTHEIRNPLSALKLNLEYLNMSIDKFSEEDAECIRASLDAVERIQILIDNTLTFSRNKNERYSYHSINYIAKQAIEMIQNTAAGKSIDITTNFEPNIPKLKFNKDKMLQVALNLITNAIEASGKNSEILISTYLTPDNSVVFEVKDQGIGISENDKNKIFTDFYTNKQNGTGLGLSVCKMLLDEIGASIDFSSELNVGTKFFVTFPKSLIEEEYETKNSNS